MSNSPIPVESRTASLTGAAFVALAAFGFSAKAILVKLAYREPVDAVTLLALRMAFALPFFLLMALSARATPQHGRMGTADRATIIGLGLLGYYLASYLDFRGLEYISAGLERLILFLYPTLVVVFSCVFLGRRIRPREGIALALSYLGIALVFRRQVSLGQADLWLGAGLVFGSTLAYAAYLMGSDRAIKRLGATRFTAYAMTIAAIACIAQFGLTHPLSALLRVSSEVYWLALAMALFSTVMPSLFLAQGIQRIGASRAALISSLGPLATIALAYAVLGETLSGDQLFGSALILVGVLLVSLGKR